MKNKIPPTFCNYKNCTYRSCKYHFCNSKEDKTNVIDLTHVTGCKLKGNNKASYELRVIDDLKKKKKKIRNLNTKCVVNLTTGVIYSSAEKASEVYGIHIDNIRKCCRGVSCTAAGCKWAYIDRYAIDF